MRNGVTIFFAMTVLISVVNGINSPYVTTEPSTNITSSSVKLRGKIEDDVGENCKYQFRYRIDEIESDNEYTDWTGSAITGQLFSQIINGFKPDSKYYFSLRAENSAGNSSWTLADNFSTLPDITSVIPGQYNTGLIIAWGRNLFGETNVPTDNNFIAISAKQHYGLGLKIDGSMLGWGCNNFVQAIPPEENGCVAVAAGGYHSLAIDTDNESVLQFKSGFEPNTYILGDKINGIDNSGPSGANSWDNLSDYLSWVLMGDGYFEGGSMQISPDPFNPANNVLHLHTFQNEEGHARSQWSLEQVHNWYVEGGPNLFKQQFYRFRMLIPDRIAMLYPYKEKSRWYMIWESHTWEFENTRHGIYIGKAAGSDEWHFLCVQRYPGSRGVILYENEIYQDVIVPIGEWFTFEIFFKYHKIDGEFYASIKRDGQPKQTIADFKGRTKYGTKLHDQMMFKLYHDKDYIIRASALGLDGIHQYYDDFEIWSDYPDKEH